MLGLALIAGSVWLALTMAASQDWHRGRTEPARQAPTEPRRGLAALPLPAQSAVSSALGWSNGAFAAARTRVGWRLAGGGVRAALGRAGLDLTTPAGSLSMALVAVGHGDGIRPLHMISGRGQANRVTLNRGNLTEWYAAGPLGIEQGFTVQHRPVGVTGGLTLALQINTASRVAATKTQVRFLTSSNHVWLRYRGLRAVDASGRRIGAGITLTGHRLVISVNDRHARYPIRIDPLIQQGPKLAANDEDTEGMFGYSVALSADGNTALIGGWDDGYSTGTVGAAWVFTRSASGLWTQQGSKLTANDESGNGELGSSVALSADGNTALIGGLADQGAGGEGYVGAAWVFTRTAGLWTQQGPKLAADDEVGPGGQFGTSVVLSANGSMALIGGPGDNNDLGAAWVFTRSSGTWTQHGSKLTVSASDEVSGAQFGAGVALSADGETALIGGPFDNSGPTNAGAAWVFTGSSGALTQQGSKLVPNDNVGFAKFGASVALTSDGNTALIGGPDDNSYAGAAWTFTRSASTWTQQGSKLTASDESGANAQFGFTVALSASGASALIGGPYDDGLGATWQFAGPPSALAQQGTKITPTGEVGSAASGWTVALAADGGTALVGGPYDNNRAGAAWVFTPPGPSCSIVSATTAAGGAQTGVQLSCSSAPGANLTYTVAAAPSHGSLNAIGQAGGQVIYTPDNGFNGQDSFTYQATDQWGDTSNVATVTITIPPAVPTCTGATAATPAGGGQVTVTLLCTAPPGVPLSYIVLTNPTHGVVSAINQTNGQVNYLPSGGYTGSDSFTYQAADAGGTSNTATATITIPPQPPTCRDVAASTPAGGGAATVSLSCHAAAGVGTSYAIVSGPSHGRLGAIAQANGQVGYTSNGGYAGTDTFTYEAIDSGGASSTATATITVPPSPPTCRDVAASTPAGGGAATVLLSCKAPPRVPVTYSIVAGPAHGRLDPISQINGAVRYVAAPATIGLDRFTYQAHDSGGSSRAATATVSIPPGQMNVKVQWSARQPPGVSSYWLFTSVVANPVPVGTRVTLSCRGHRCGVAHRVITVKAPVRCHRHRCVTQHGTSSRTVDLTPALRGHMFKVGAVLTIRFKKALWTSQLNTFVVETHTTTCAVRRGTARPRVC